MNVVGSIASENVDVDRLDRIDARGGDCGIGAIVGAIVSTVKVAVRG